ncbi:TPA: Wzz/FepE/Etk N-terminal domain-containing protein [Vibrio diabolicus]
MNLKPEEYTKLSTSFSYQTTDESITLLELIRAIWQGKLIIIMTTLTLAVASVVFALYQPNIYRASALLSPSDSQSSSGLGQMAGQFGGLAALAGVSLGGAESRQTELAVQVMKSRKFVSEFIEKHNLLVTLMGTRGWNIGSDTLVYDEDAYDLESEKWLRKPDGLRGAKPSNQEAYEVFINDVFSITQDKESGLYTVSIMHYSPYIAEKWVNWIVSDINKVMRERTIAESTQNLAYLNNQLNKTSVAEMQSTFYKLIEEQTKSLMLAEVQEEFVFKVVDPAVVPEVKVKPSRALICIGGTLFGFIIGLSVVFIRFVLIRDKNKLNSNI